MALTLLSHLSGLGNERVMHVFALAFPDRATTVNFALNGDVYYEKVEIEGIAPTFNQMQNQTDAVIAQANTEVAALEEKRRKWDKLVNRHGLDGVIVGIMQAGVSGDWSNVQQFLTWYDA